MHVNKLPSLLSSHSKFPGLVAVLRNDLYRSCKINNTQGNCDSAYCMLQTRSCHLSEPHPRDKPLLPFEGISNLNNKQYSRFSASTIMRPHTKCFSFNDYNVIGFDLDGTILRYNLDRAVPMEYEFLCRYLVEQKGYSEKLLEKPNHWDFLQKGLFLDAERGNLLKLNCDGCILKACHGTHCMTDEEINETYGKCRQWSVTTQLINDPLCAWNGPLSEKVRGLLDYFDIGVSLVFARAIDEIDAARDTNSKLEQPSYHVWSDILEALVNIYSRDHFTNGKSGYFERIKSDPDSYLLKTSPSVVNLLKELKAANKKTFLLTGSHIDFADFTATYALGKDWKDLFDVVVCFARKPGFFLNNREFHHINGFEEGDPIAFDGKLELNKVYSMGNWKQLQELFAQSLGKDVSELKSLYVGDNLIQDVYAPDALTGIDSLAISEEMLGESTLECPNCFKNITTSSYWNSYFYDEGIPTIWTHIIEKHSKMCVPTLDFAAGEPVDHQFTMNNEIGFYPAPPSLID